MKGFIRKVPSQHRGGATAGMVKGFNREVASQHRGGATACMVKGFSREVTSQHRGRATAGRGIALVKWHTYYLVNIEELLQRVG